MKTTLLGIRSLPLAFWGWRRGPFRLPSLQASESFSLPPTASIRSNIVRTEIFFLLPDTLQAPQRP